MQFSGFEEFFEECYQHIDKYFIATFIVIISIWFIRKIFKKYKSDKIIIKKRKDVDNKKLSLFQKLQGLKIPFKNIKECCHLNGSELLEKISSGELSPVDILEAYQANALIKTNEFHFIADIVYDADVSALLINKNDRHNLLGWPLSVKDAFLIEKYDCTQGLKSKILKPSSITSTVIKALKEDGAIPFIITNVSQGLQKYETSNPIFGKTLNPFNVNMTCGGSSGGEATALGCDSSLIGLGSDACGGIRIPASYCGIFGLKPTSSRVSSRHTDKTFFCNLTVKTSIGPMARHIDDLIVTFRSMTSNRIFEMDPYNPPIPFNETLLLNKSPLKIGYYTHIGGAQIQPVPAVERALLLAKQALENVGYELVEFCLPDIDDIFRLISKSFMLDGGDKLFKDGLKDDPVDKSLLFNQRMFKTPRWIRYAISHICCIFDKRLGQSIIESTGSSVFEALKLNDKVIEYREKVLTMLENGNLEGIICPVSPIAAPPLNKSHELQDTDIYCTVYNILDYPAGSVPITKVTDEDIKNLDALYPKKSRINKIVRKLQMGSRGLPVGVQCVVKPWRDELCLRIMKDISTHLYS